MRSLFLLFLALSLLAASVTAHAATVSKKYKFEKNKPLGLELSAADVRAEQIVFEIPGSVLRFQSADKARISVTNGSERKARVGLAIALFDSDGNLVGAGTGGNKGGKVNPGESEEFSVFFYYVSERIENAHTFNISLEIN